MNNVIPLSSAAPVLLTPSPRIMRNEGQTQDRYTVNGKQVVRELNPGETSTAWSPRLVPLFSFPYDGTAHSDRPVQAGNAVAIVRPGYEGAPLGIATSVYRPVDRSTTVQDVTEATAGRATHEGALVDGHGYHVVDAFRLETVGAGLDETEKAADEITVAFGGETKTLPLVSRLMLVHDHTGGGSLRASVVCYLGDDIVVGSACFTRRIHVGAGSKDVGVGSRSRWLSVVDAMLDTAVLQQGAIAALLAKASETAMTEEAAKAFEARGVFVEREKVSKEEKQAAADRGESEPRGAIVEKTALDVVVAFHKQRSGRLSWGVWSRRLEGDALSALEEITGIALPKQLFRRGGV